ncbi:MAG TPA: ImmA/IrrE family metallo-endopeptidase [Pyrinomonadaceae bacterium]
MRWRGIYMACEGIPCIAIHSSLRGAERSEVVWHEIGHHLLHTPTTCFFTRSTARKMEFEAQVVMACALVPRPLLGRTFAELQEEYGYTRELLWFRKGVFEQFRT